MNGDIALLSLAAFANLVLGVAVLLKNPHALIHRYFALFSISVAVWTLSNSLLSVFAQTELGYMWARLAFASSAVIAVAFLLFATVFPTPDPPSPRLILVVMVSVGIAAFVTSFSALIVRGTTSTGGRLQVLYGPLHRPFGLYFVTCFGFSLYLLTRKLLRLRGIQKLQLRYLFFAVLTAAVGATFTNLVIPIVSHTSEFSRYGPLFGILMVAVIAHAIIRHRLLDIRVVIRQGAVYVCSIVVAAACFFIGAELLHRLTGYTQSAIPLVQALALAVLVAIFFQPLKSWVQTSLNTYLYRYRYDYQRTLRDASHHLTTMLALQPLLEYLAEVIDDTLRVDRVLVFLKDPATGSFIEKFSRETGESSERPLRLSEEKSHLTTFLAATRRVLVREDAIREPGHVASLNEAAHELAALGGDLALPILDDQRLSGLVVVGPKRSGDAFFAEDLDLLWTLITQASLTMKNAQLYQQVVLINEYVENILRTMDSGVITVDGNGQVALCNSTAERLTGLAKVELASLTVDSLPPALGLQLKATLGDGLARSQTEVSLEIDKDKRVPLACSTSALRDDRGRIIGSLMVFSDVSKIKELENEKRRAERLASFGSLVSGIAHEIKNPLVAIKTFAELLPERFSDSDFRGDFSKVVGTEIDRIDGLVGRLRSLAAPAPQSIGPTDIREPILETLSLLRGQFEQTRTTVNRELGSSRLLVAIDPAQIKQLFLNLFLNAIEAMGQGGKLRVHTGRRHRLGQYWVYVEVEDTGPGIPEGLRARIFEPFFTTKATGSGLGLAICRSITDAHRGTITLNSEGLGRGTLATIEFPAADAVSEAPRRAVVGMY
jgi:PAS domain S-box-containing protein